MRTPRERKQRNTEDEESGGAAFRELFDLLPITCSTSTAAAAQRCLISQDFCFHRSDSKNTHFLFNSVFLGLRLVMTSARDGEAHAL